MIADVVLVTLGLIGLLFGSVTDIRKREVPDWMNYSLIAAGIGIRLINGLVGNDPSYFTSGLIGLAIMFAIGNIMYYTRQWGGGDAKLLIALGAIFATRPYFIETNYPFLLILFINIIFFGAIYGVLYGLFLAMKNRKEFLSECKKLVKTPAVRALKLFILAFVVMFILSIIFFENRMIPIFIGIAALFFIVMTYSWILMKSVENACMYKTITVDKLTPGDWIVDPSIKKKYGIPALGIEKKQVEAIRNSGIKNIEIKEGIPFVPSFLIGFLITIFSGKALLLF